MTFQDAQLRLLAYVRDRIHNGELTERGLARLIGISQPHVHNVLKGARSLSIDMSDSILKLFHMSLLDLAPPEDLEANLERRKAPEPVLELAFLESAIGPGMPWPAGVDWRRRFPAPIQARTVPAGWVMARLVNDLEMHLTLARSDIAILDTSEGERTNVSPAALYAVSRRGEALLRHVRPGANCYYLVTDLAMNRPAYWDKIGISAHELPGLVRARVLWLGRERDRNLPMHQRGRFL